MKLLKYFSSMATLSIVGSTAALAVELPECNNTATITTTTAEPHIYFQAGGLRTEATTISIFNNNGQEVGAVSIQLKTVKEEPMSGCYYTPDQGAQSYCREDDENAEPVTGTLSEKNEGSLACYYSAPKRAVK